MFWGRIAGPANVDSHFKSLMIYKDVMIVIHVDGSRNAVWRALSFG